MKSIKNSLYAYCYSWQMLKYSVENWSPKFVHSHANYTSE